QHDTCDRRIVEPERPDRVEGLAKPAANGARDRASMRDHQYAALGVARAQLVERGLYPACETDHRLAAGRWIVDRRLEPAPVAFPIFRAHSLQRAALPRSQPDLAQAVHRDRREAERGLAGRRRVARAAERARVESVEAYRAEAGGQRAG